LVITSIHAGFRDCECAKGAQGIDFKYVMGQNLDNKGLRSLGAVAEHCLRLDHDPPPYCGWPAVSGQLQRAKEVVGGFALLRANSMQEAIELARQFLQVAGDGECEIHQIFEAGQNTCADAAA
jgi:hypothetical protein